MIKNSIAALALFASLTLPHASSAQSIGFENNEAASAILSSGTRALKVRALRSVPSVGVIYVTHGFAPRLSTFGESISTLRISAERNHAGIVKLRAALSSNAITRQALASHGVAINRVVGVQIGSNGSLRVFVI